MIRLTCADPDLLLAYELPLVISREQRQQAERQVVRNLEALDEVDRLLRALGWDPLPTSPPRALEGSHEAIR